MRAISPSQIKLYRQCPRSFAFRYVEGFRTEQSDAMKHGSLMHKHLELYLLRGKRPPHAHAMAVLREAPKPLTALAEAKIEWDLGDPWTYQGIMDFSGALVSRASFTTSPFMADLSAPIVIGDFKFTSQLKFALEEKGGVLVDRESGEVDPQSTMYASRYFAKGYEKVHGKWIYSRTTGKAKCHPVWVDFSHERVAEEMATSIAHDSEEIHQLYQIRPKGNEVRYDKGGCFAFNKVCDHIGYCNRPTRMFDCAETDAESAGEEDMGFADDIMKGFPGSEVPPVEDGEIPDLDDGEIPDVLEGEREGVSEEEQLELIASELARQRREAGKAEKGFVNPPEAPDTAAASPEEAFERFGDAVVEKPKKEKAPRAPKEPSMKFGGKQRGKLFAKALELGLVEADNEDRALRLSRLLAENGVDLAAMFPELVSTPAVENISQTDVLEEEIPLVDEEVPDIIDTDGEEIADLGEDVVEHSITGDELEERMRTALAADATEERESDFDGPTEERARFEAEPRTECEILEVEEAMDLVGELCRNMATRMKCRITLTFDSRD